MQVPSSPAASLTGLLPPLSISSQMASGSNLRGLNDMGRSQTELFCSSSQRTGDAIETYIDGKTRRPRNSEEFSVDSSRSQNSGYSSSPNSNATSISGIAVVVSDDLIEVELDTNLSSHNSYDHTSSVSHQKVCLMFYC